MSNEIFNNSLAFIPYPYARNIIGLDATLIEGGTGLQQVIPHTGHDRRRFILNLTGFERTERDTAFQFYLGRQGIVEDFLFRDVIEVAGAFVVRQQIAVGDGLTSVFQLNQTIGGKTFNRWDIDEISTGAPADPKIWVNSVLQSTPAQYTIAMQADGRVTFSSPPIFGHVIEAEYYYLRRCRFAMKWGDVEANYEWENFIATLDERIVVPV